jgi:hypothetical protein
VVGAELARGGVGFVSHVRDRVTGEVLAMKRLIAGTDSDRRLVEAFEREYQVLTRLDHPRIIRVFDYGIDAQGPYYTMELLAGADLRSAAPLPFRKACLLLRDVATSLSLIHARRMVHRDLSPNNVRMTEDGHCKLLDFGALIEFGPSDTIIGTAPCIPPEALQGRPLDQRADLYALGALAYWVLTGRHAYPAQSIRELPNYWKTSPVPPSSFAPDTPAQLDALVLSLLHKDPLARPPSAAEVIAHLEVIGGLPSEDVAAAQRNAQSFFTHPRFTGRSHEQQELRDALDAAKEGRGRALCIRAMAGMGRSRLLEETGLSAQLSGFTVLRADASMSGQLYGTTRALAVALMRSAPESMVALAGSLPASLELLGLERPAAARERVPRKQLAQPSLQPPSGAPTVDGWLAQVSAQRPLVVLVDNVDYADAASLGMLAGLAQKANEHALLLVISECSSRGSREAVGVSALRNQAQVMELIGLSVVDIRALVQSLFGDVPNLERFADWLHEYTAGSPLHAVETCRQLVQRRIIRHTAGVWTLPIARPDTELPTQLGEALLARLSSLSPDARALAECLSLQHEQPTLELCLLLTDNADREHVRGLLAELTRDEVLYVDQDGYRFTSTALRDALLGDMDGIQLEHRHRRLGQAFAVLSADGDLGLQLKAGWHLIMGGHELRGADMIADVTRDAESVRGLMSDMHRTGRALEAALKVYGRHGRSLYARLPLLSGLAQAGFCEELSWSTRYGDQALDAAADLSGLRTARRLRRFIGAWPALLIGIFMALLRFLMTPKRDRAYSFRQLLTHVFTTAAALTGTAALSLDAQRAETTAAILEPFSILPDRLTPAGVYLYCHSLCEIGRENEAEAYKKFGLLIERLSNPRYYPALPAANRGYLLAGAHFARASFAIFRADGANALESAKALDETGFQLYAMIASQLRYLYYTLRGEFAEAALHRAQVELHAAHVGSIWQVETWESPALLLLHTYNLGDIVGATRLVHRLEIMSQDVPSLRRYSRIAKHVLLLVRGDYGSTEAVAREYEEDPPRSYIGWTASRAAISLGYNLAGQHAQARAFAEQTRAHITDEDHDYPALFILNEVALALAEANSGEALQGLRRIEVMLKRFAGCDHRLLLGQLHEARGRIAWMLGRELDYRESLAQTERYLKPTGEPSLVARCVRLARLANPAASWLPGPPDAANDQFETVEMPHANSLDGQTQSSSRTRSAKLPSGQRGLPPE